MPPLPAAAGGGPGQTSFIRLDVRLSVKLPHVSHQWTTPDVTKLCGLPPPKVLPPLSAARVVNGFVPVPSHLEVANLIQDVDLVLQAMQSKQ